FVSRLSPRYGSAYALMSAPAVEKCVNETRYSFPPTEESVIRGTVATAWPFTKTGNCQSWAPVFVSKACTIPTPFGYCGVATIRPISDRPLAVVVTGLAQPVALPAAMPPVETSSCFQTILFVAGLN